MPDAENPTTNQNNERLSKIVAKATENARAKNARLRHLKERNENYLAERKDYEDSDEERTQEL
jgi:hypothetical protein